MKLNQIAEEEDEAEILKLIRQGRDVVKEKRTGLITFLAHFCFNICTSIAAFKLPAHYYEYNLMNEMEDNLSSLVSIIHIGSHVSRARFQSQKAELFASSWINETQFSSFRQTLSEISMISKQISIDEDKSLKALNLRKRIQGRSFVVRNYPFSYLMKDRSVSMIKDSYKEGIYQLLSSLSVISNAKKMQLSREFDKEGSILTQERTHFYRVDYNSWNSLRKGAYDSLEDFDNFIKQRNHLLFYILLIPIGMHMILGMLGSSVNIFLIPGVLDNDSDILSFFSMVKRGEAIQLYHKVLDFKMNFLQGNRISEKKTNQKRVNLSQQEDSSEVFERDLGDDSGVDLIAQKNNDDDEKKTGENVR